MPRTIAIGDIRPRARLRFRSRLLGRSRTDNNGSTLSFPGLHGEGVLSRGVPDVRAFGVAGRLLDAG
jgi:hypothetical protein